MPTIGKCVELFIQDRVLRGLSLRTVQIYTDILKMLTDDIGAETKIADAPILDYCYNLSNKSWAKSTLWNHLKSIRAWHSWCVENKLCEPVNLPRMRQPKSNIRPMSPAQVRQVLRSFDVDTFLGLRNQTAIRLMFTMGLRVGEVVKLRIDDVDLANRKMLVRGKGDKDVWLPIPKKTAKHLWHYLVRRETRKNANSLALFVNRNGGAMSPNGLKCVFKKLQAQFKFPGVRLSAHTMRHSFAVAFLELGGGNVFELQQLLRHEDLEMTRRYVHLAQAQLMDAVDRSSPDGLV